MSTSRGIAGQTPNVVARRRVRLPFRKGRGVDLVVGRGQADVHRAEDGEHVGLQERNQHLESVHGEQEQHPRDGDASHADARALDGRANEHAGEQRENAENHMAGEHVSVESNGQREHAQHGGEQLEEPHDGNHDQRQARRRERLEVAAEALGLDAPEDEVDERDGRERQVMLMDPWGSCSRG